MKKLFLGVAATVVAVFLAAKALARVADDCGYDEINN